MGRKCEPGDVGAGNETHTEFVTVLLLSVVDRKAFAELDGCGADNVVHVGVVGWGTPEDLDANGALFDLLGGTLEGLFDDVTEELD